MLNANEFANAVSEFCGGDNTLTSYLLAYLNGSINMVELNGYLQSWLPDRTAECVITFLNTSLLI